MTKAELIAALAKETDLSKAKAEECLVQLGAIITSELAVGNDVSLPQLGRLRTVRREERQGRNPRTGAPVTIPARWRVTFVSSKALKEILG